MPFDNAIKQEIMDILGLTELPNNLAKLKKDLGVDNQATLVAVVWAMECRFDINTDLEDFNINTWTVKDFIDYIKLKIAEDPVNNPEVP